jgi:hypothetical protein
MIEIGSSITITMVETESFSSHTDPKMLSVFPGILCSSAPR